MKKIQVQLYVAIIIGFITTVVGYYSLLTTEKTSNQLIIDVATFILVLLIIIYLISYLIGWIYDKFKRIKSKK